MIKKDDNVIIIAGRDKGKSGKVITSIPKTHQVIVEGINMMKKNQKPRQKGQKGQVITKTMPIDISNVRLENTAKKAVVKKVTAPKKTVKTEKK
jgi:large subunit ribosomal protein L24